MDPMRSKIKLINVVGIDGAGKTELSKLLLQEYRIRYPDTAYIHSYHEPLLLWPLKVMARSILLGNTDEYIDYSKYQKRKKKASRRHNILSNLYGYVWIVDYAIQAFLRVGVLDILGKRVIIDRYIYDTVVNVSLTANWPQDKTYRMVKILLKLLPTPDIVFLIDLPESVAIERKEDIQSIQYLQERRQIYLKMANKFGFSKLNGQNSPSEILSQAVKTLNG